MRSDNNMVVAIMDFGVNIFKLLIGVGVSVEANDAGVWKNFVQFTFKLLSAKTFVNNLCVVAFRAASGDLLFVTTVMTKKGELIVMKREW